MDTDHEQQNRIKLVNADGEAWRQFLADQINMLYGMFLKQWPNRSLAEELVQRTVFDAVRGRTTYDVSKGSPQQWLCGIARNQIRLEIRRRAAGPHVNGDLSSYLETLEDKWLPDEILERQETADVVKTALEQLNTKEKQVLKAKYLDDLSARDIARQMDISEKAVHSLLYRARNHLREVLKHEVL